jgi:hypothetical protein
MEIFKIIIVVVAMALAVWVLYTLVKLSDKAKDMPDEAPYKLEATEDVAVSNKPKRNYTKRSSYWTAKRKKAAASKAKKQTSKSK